MRQHPAVAQVLDDRTRSERFADAMVDGMASVRFLMAQTAVVAVWVGLNLTAWSLRWDPYPFILLNLAFSTQAAYAAPMILLAGRRSEQKRDAQAAHDHRMVSCMHRSAATGECTCGVQP